MNQNEFTQCREAAWQLVNEGRLADARTSSEKLVRSIANELETHEGDRELLHRLAGACHVAGYTVNLSVRSPYAAVAGGYFDQMLHTARQLRDASLCVRALCYRGDLARRYGDPQKAWRSLQLAYRIGPVDPVAHGTSAQMLARLCGEMGEVEQFHPLMGEAEQIAATLPPGTSLPGQLFSVGALLVDSCFFSWRVGEWQKALDCLTQAEKALPDSLFWRTQLTALRGLLLVHTGLLDDGMPLVLHAVELANEQGNQFLLEHFSALQRFMGKTSLAWNKADVQLGEALHGRL